MTFAAPPTEDSVVEISIFPMTAGAPFAQEPKLVISLQHGKEARTVDLVTETSATTSVITTLNGADVALNIGIPEVPTATEIMLNVRAGYRGLPQYSTPWQVFSLGRP